MEAKNWHLMSRTINSLDLAWVSPLGFSFSKCKTYGDYIGIRFNQQSRSWTITSSIWNYIQCNSLTLFVDIVIEICDWNWHVHRFQMTASPLLSLTLPNCYLTPIPCISSPSNNGLVLIGGLFVHTCGAMCSIKFNA